MGRIVAGYGHPMRIVRLDQGQTVPPDLDDVTGIISMGGTMNVDEAERHAWMKPEMTLIRAAHEAGLPVVGICLGAQLIAAALGGKVEAMGETEIGWETVKLSFPGTTDPLHAGIAWETMQFHFHGQAIAELPSGAVGLSGSKRCRHQAFRIGFRTYGFQYHPEWTMDDIRRFTALDWVLKTGHDPNQILQQSERYYEPYRRLGNRLCHNIANYLMPLDRQLARA